MQQTAPNTPKQPVSSGQDHYYYDGLPTWTMQMQQHPDSTPENETGLGVELQMYEVKTQLELEDDSVWLFAIWYCGESSRSHASEC